MIPIQRPYTEFCSEEGARYLGHGDSACSWAGRSEKVDKGFCTCQCRAGVEHHGWWGQFRGTCLDIASDTVVLMLVMYEKVYMSSFGARNGQLGLWNVPDGSICRT